MILKQHRIEHQDLDSYFIFVEGNLVIQDQLEIVGDVPLIGAFRVGVGDIPSLAGILRKSILLNREADGVHQLVAEQLLLARIGRRLRLQQGLIDQLQQPQNHPVDFFDLDENVDVLQLLLAVHFLQVVHQIVSVHQSDVQDGENVPQVQYGSVVLHVLVHNLVDLRDQGQG